MTELPYTAMAPIYDAMNQAVQYASGDYVYFLNCGDSFYNENVLADVAKYIEEHLLMAFNNGYLAGISYDEAAEKYPTIVNNIPKDKN